MTALQASSMQSTCKVCGEAFARMNTMQVVCGIRCARKVPVIAKQAARRLDGARRDALKTRQMWLRECQAAFNAFIRIRDADKPCICCGKWGASVNLTGGEWDAGHYRSTGSAPHLRFDESNVHRQLKQCNRYGAGRAVDYRIGLVARLGVAEVERLESDNLVRKFTVDELKVIRATYREKAKLLLSARDCG